MRGARGAGEGGILDLLSRTMEKSNNRKKELKQILEKGQGHHFPVPSLIVQFCRF